MAVNKKLIDRIQGDTFSRVTFVATDKVGAPIDLTSTEIVVTMRYKNSCGAIVKTIGVDEGITISDGPNGTFEIDQFTPITFAAGRYVFNLTITYTDGVIKTYIMGSFNVLENND
tara:strand:+ start:171 stop:515 length:345 start_codon:yes stop_codon:yes gene_type:complete